MGLLEETLRGKSLADYTNTQLRLALGAVLYTNTADMWRAYLTQQGYTGSVADMLAKYYIDHDVPQQFRNYINAGLYLFSPRQLFRNGEQGYVYDLNDLSTLYLDSAGTTPASVNGLVGLVLDKSKVGPVARRNRLTYSEQFDNAAWSTAAAGGGTAPVVTANAGTAPDGTTTADKVVFVAPVSGDMSQLAQAPAVSAGTYAGSLYIKADGAGDVGKIIAFRHVAAGASLLVTLTASWQRIEKTEVYASSNFEIVLRPSVGTSAGTVSVQLWGAQLEIAASASEYQRVVTGNGDWIAGNHAYQSTTGNKPVLRGTPVGGNMVTNGDFASGLTGWTNPDTAPATTTASGGGALMNNGTTGTARLRQTLTVGAGNYRIRFTVSGLTGPITAGTLAIGNGPSGDSTYGAVGITRNGTFEFYTGSVTGPTLGLAFVVVAGSACSFTLDNVEVHDISAGSVQAPYALQFDGVDDFLQTASVNFTATDKMTVCHGVRKLSDAALGGVVEIGTGLSAGFFAIFAPNGAAGSNYQFRNTGSLQDNAIAAGYAPPVTNVITGVGNIAGDSTVLRINGSVAVSSSNDLGTGNYSNAILYFGRRGGTSSPYNGLMFSAICVGKAVSATELANIERWTNQRTGAY